MNKTQRVALVMGFCMLLCAGSYDVVAQHMKDIPQPRLPYESHMDSVFVNWLRLNKAREEGCKHAHTCSSAMDIERIELPLKLMFRNTNQQLNISEKSAWYVVSDALTKSGYSLVKAEEYAGPHSDTLLVVYDLSDTKLRIRFNVLIGSKSNSHVGEICGGGRAHEVGALVKGDSANLSDIIDEFRLGGELNAVIADGLECYFDEKKWPTFFDLEEQSREDNFWYKWRYPYLKDQN